MKKIYLYYFKLLSILVITCVQSQDSVANKNESGLNSLKISDKIANKLNQAGDKIKSDRLIDEPACTEDIKRLCSRTTSVMDNLSILNCIQNQQRDDSALLSTECHQVIWSYKYSLTQSTYIEDVLKKMCKGEQHLLKECTTSGHAYGNLIACVLQNYDSIKKLQCQEVTIHLASIVFSDYHLVQHVTDNCKDDIERLQCGRVQTFTSSEPHSQGLTIECLSKHTSTLGTECQHQILSLAELQSEDFHLDRALYFGCREDRERFCSKIRTGNGKVFQCLLKHQQDRTMSLSCSDQLQRRKGLIAQDYKVSRGLVTACKLSIKELRCKKGTNTEENYDMKLSKILVCLQAGLRKGKISDGACKQEIISHRRILLNVSPKIAFKCESELGDSCLNVKTEKKLHCLMQLYKRNRKSDQPLLSAQCQRALEEVMKETDVGEDWRVDPVLYEACLPVVQARCKNVKDGKGRIMRCLMHQINSPAMTDICKSSLLEIMYFVSRDWKLDPQLYSSCLNDSVKFCHADTNWIQGETEGPDGNILVLPCLFRYAYRPTTNSQDSSSLGQLTRLCSSEVRRVMYERSSYVSLHPQIEMECLPPLALFCSDRTGPGEEMYCLQQNLDQLDGLCRTLIANYTAAEAKDTGLNSLVKMHCSEVIDKMCDHVSSSEENSNDGGIMDCLIERKNSKLMLEQFKCRAVVENFQVVMMKDVHFSPSFREMCMPSMNKFCRDSLKRQSDLKSQLDCLSDIMMNDALDDHSSSMPKRCVQQIRKLLKQRHESVNLDPELKNSCSDEINEFCTMEAGDGKVLECLRTKRLGVVCKQVVFKRKREESFDPFTDVVLMRNCRRMIKNFCKNIPSEQVFLCLKEERDHPDFDLKCRTVITSRMVERSKDSRLNPFLVKACKYDMKKFCQEELHFNLIVERNGKVIECLKKHLTGRKLSNKCESRVIRLTKGAALNYKLDPILVEKCQKDLTVVCIEEQTNAAEKGEVEECLKLQLEKKQLSEECSVHVSEIITIEKVDIRADPLLYSVCSIDDDKFCSERTRGTHLACLYDIMNRHPETLLSECREKLSERKEMFKSALLFANPESLNELVESVRSSPRRNYLMIVLLTVIGVIFLSGLTCGRFSRRTKALLKNR